MGELVARKYKTQSDGSMRLVSKEDIKKEGGRSPDWGDAVAMAFAPPPRGLPHRPALQLHAGHIYGR